MREPADRARSQFAYVFRRDPPAMRTAEAFDRRVRRELSRAQSMAQARGSSGPPDWHSALRTARAVGGGYEDVLARSLYVAYLEAWLATYDCRQMLLLRFEA